LKESSWLSCYERAAPYTKTPMIVILNEIDVRLATLLKIKLQPSTIQGDDAADVITLKTKDENVISHDRSYNAGFIHDKTDWNDWLDQINTGYYRHVIIIMTTNQPLSVFNNQPFDASLTRQDRVHIKMTMTHDNCEILPFETLPLQEDADKLKSE
jgi:hypothetical protein